MAKKPDGEKERAPVTILESLAAHEPDIISQVTENQSS